MLFRSLIPEIIGIPLRIDTSLVKSSIKSRPLFLIARFEPGTGISTALLRTLAGNRCKQFKSESIINSSAIFREFSFAPKSIERATGEYLIAEYTVKPSMF